MSVSARTEAFEKKKKEYEELLAKDKHSGLAEILAELWSMNKQNEEHIDAIHAWMICQQEKE